MNRSTPRRLYDYTFAAKTLAPTYATIGMILGVIVSACTAPFFIAEIQPVFEVVATAALAGGFLGMILGLTKADIKSRSQDPEEIHLDPVPSDENPISPAHFNRVPMIPSTSDHIGYSTYF